MQVSTVSATSGSTGTVPGKADLKKAAQQFEAIFLRQMIGAMRTASLGEGITDSSATDQFRDLADARTADSMATKGALGIAELLLKQFSAPQPSATAAPAAPQPTAPDGPIPAEGA